MARFLVTGASRGLGRSVAATLIAHGHEVLALVRNSEAVEGLQLSGLWIGDLAHPAGLSLPSNFPSSLDGVVHAAAIGLAGPVAGREMQLSDLVDQMTVNFTAVVVVTSLVLPNLRLTGGTVVFVNSGAGFRARPPFGFYGAAKHALRGYADALREQEPSIRVSTIYPGRIATDMQRMVQEVSGGTYESSRYLQPDTLASLIGSMMMLPADGIITDLSVRHRDGA
jgi:NAD(P)-dependent dehydrogenase (short-subunit alcohol dehydrogenase family)